jgi:hypothetical protein
MAKKTSRNKPKPISKAATKKMLAAYKALKQSKLSEDE